MYVDDIILTASSDRLYTYIKTPFGSEFAMKVLGPLSYFCILLLLVMTMVSSYLKNNEYAAMIIERVGMSNSPLMFTKSKLSATTNKYRSLADALQYLTFTRLDISYTVQ